MKKLSFTIVVLAIFETLNTMQGNDGNTLKEGQICDQNSCKCYSGSGRGATADCTKNQWCWSEGMDAKCYPAVTPLANGDVCQSVFCGCGFNEKKTSFKLSCNVNEKCFESQKSFFCAAQKINEGGLCNDNKCLCEPKAGTASPVICGKEETCHLVDDYLRCAKVVIDFTEKCTQSSCLCKPTVGSARFSAKIISEYEFCYVFDGAARGFSTILEFNQKNSNGNSALCPNTDVSKSAECQQDEYCLDGKQAGSICLAGDVSIFPSEKCDLTDGFCLCTTKPNTERVPTFGVVPKHESCLLYKQSWSYGERQIFPGDVCTLTKGRYCGCFDKQSPMTTVCPGNHKCINENSKLICQNFEPSVPLCSQSTCICKALTADGKTSSCTSGQYCIPGDDSACLKTAIVHNEICNDPAKCACVLDKKDTTTKISGAVCDRSQRCLKSGDFETSKTMYCGKADYLSPGEQGGDLPFACTSVAKTEAASKPEQVVGCPGNSYCFSDANGANKLVCAARVLMSGEIIDQGFGICHQKTTDLKSGILCSKGQECRTEGPAAKCLDGPFLGEKGVCEKDLCWCKTPDFTQPKHSRWTPSVQCSANQICGASYLGPVCVTIQKYNQIFSVANKLGNLFLYVSKTHDSKPFVVSQRNCPPKYEAQLESTSSDIVCTGTTEHVVIQRFSYCTNPNTGGCKCYNSIKSDSEICHAGEQCLQTSNIMGKLKANCNYVKYNYFECPKGIYCFCGFWTNRNWPNREFCDLTGLRNSFENSNKGFFSKTLDFKTMNRMDDYRVLAGTFQTEAKLTGRNLSDLGSRKASRIKI